MPRNVAFCGTVVAGGEPADLIGHAWKMWSLQIRWTLQGARKRHGAPTSDGRGRARVEDVEPANLMDVAGRARKTWSPQICLTRAILFDSAGAASNAELVD